MAAERLTARGELTQVVPVDVDDLERRATLRAERARRDVRWFVRLKGDLRPSDDHAGCEPSVASCRGTPPRAGITQTPPRACE